MQFASSLKVAVAAALLLLPGYAQAQVWRGATTTVWQSVGTAATNYALDGMGTVTRACGLRRLLTSYTTDKLVRLRRTSDDAELDIGRTSTGAIDTATAVTHCAATTCFVRTCYEQSGNAVDLVQATAANQPAFIFDCNGAAPCIRTTAAAQTIVTAGSVTPASGLVSFSLVANRGVGTGACVLIRENGNANRVMTRNAVANNWTLAGGTSGTVFSVAADAAWHSYSAVINGTSSVANLDGTEVFGTATGSTGAGSVAMVGAASTTCDIAEVAIFDDVDLVAARREMLRANQHAWWMF